MIPDIAVIVSAYAVARLVGEYILTKESQAEALVAIAVIAIAVVVYFLWDVIQKSNSLGSTLGGLNLG